MTPKEKAIELVLKFYKVVKNKYPLKNAVHLAKQCAIIAVDEIITNMNGLEEKGKLKEDFDKYQFWLEVKAEIEKL